MEQEAIICSVFLLLLLALVRRGLNLYNLSTVVFDDICSVSLRVMVEKRTPRRAWAFSKASKVAGYPFNTV